jgi:branched-subunit amino acid transport protein AzlD
MLGVNDSIPVAKLIAPAGIEIKRVFNLTRLWPFLIFEKQSADRVS